MFRIAQTQAFADALAGRFEPAAPQSAVSGGPTAPSTNRRRRRRLRLSRFA